jgi:(R,R)-butanediol dehydrogenase/meso-butanediol dehydrogenase/diacetyl reductase
LKEHALLGAALIQPGEIRLVERLERDPEAHEVKIAVSYVGICGSDLARFEGGQVSPKPVVFGHEFSGRIVDLGRDVSGFQAGQPVTVAPLLNCGRCLYCQGGRGYLCAERRRFGSDLDGALQAYVCMRADRVFRLPGELSLAHGAVAEPLAVAVHAVHQAGDVRGVRVAVLGGGAIGLLVAAVCREFGARQILVVEPNSQRAELAAQLGYSTICNQDADPVPLVLEDTGGQGADLVFEASGAFPAGASLLPLMAKGSTAVVVGRIKEAVPIDLDALLLKEGKLVSSRYFSLADFRQAVDFIVGGELDVTPLIQSERPFLSLAEDCGRPVMQAARRVVRLMITMD